MSDINLDFTQTTIDANFVVNTNEISFTPSAIEMTFNPNFKPLAGGSPTQLQYNNGGELAGITTATYDGSNLALGDVANLKITGGTNGYVLQTDGLGNLDWTAQTGGGGGGSPGGSNTQIQYNDSGTFGGATGFTFNEVTGNVNIPGNLIVVGSISGTINSNYANYAGNVVNANQPNITTVGTLVNLTVTNPINGNVNGSAVTATTAGTVTTNAQPNITSVGSLSSLDVLSYINTDTLNISNIANINIGKENIVIISAPSTSYNLDILTSPIRYANTNASSNISLNIRGNSTITFGSLLSNGQSITTSYVMTTGATPYGITSLSIDGSSVTPKYAGSTTQVSNSIVTYTYTIIKNSGTYTVLGSITRYQ